MVDLKKDINKVAINVIAVFGWAKKA